MGDMVCDVEYKFNTESHYLFVHSDGDMEPRELLRKLMERDGENPNSLAKRLRGKITQPQIYKFVTGTAKEPRRATLQPLADHFGLPIEAFYDQAVATRAAQQMGLSGVGLAAPVAAEPGARYDALTNAERALLDNFRSLPDEDQAEISGDISHRAEKARAHIQKVLQRMGLADKEIPELGEVTAKDLEVFHKAHVRAPDHAAKRKAS